MIEAVVSFFQEFIVLIQASFSTFALLSFPILTWLAIYTLNLLEQQKQVSIGLSNKPESQVAQEIDDKSVRIGPILGGMVSSFFPSSNSILGRKFSSSQPIISGSSEYDDLSANYADMYNNDCVNEDIQRPYKRPFSSSKFYEVGLCLFATLGGASFFLLDTSSGFINNIEPFNVQKIERLNDRNVQEIDNNMDLSIVDLDSTKNLAEKELDVLESGDKSKLPRLSLGTYPKTNLLTAMPKEIIYNKPNDDLLLRRLMFDLTPKEYASLIPSSLEMDWYGLSSLRI